MKLTPLAARRLYCVVALFVAITFSASGLQAAPITVPGDLAPGFSYRLAFVTGPWTGAASSDISYYNTFVSAVAAGVPELAALATTWTAIGSTTSIDARDNTSTNPSSTGVPIYTLAGTRIANNNADLWDGSLQLPLNIAENGNPLEAIVWTGSVASGTVDPTMPLGTPSGVRAGNAAHIDSRWIIYGWQKVTTDYRLYAISDVLVAPEPATMIVLAAGLPFLLKRKQRKKA